MQHFIYLAVSLNSFTLILRFNCFTRGRRLALRTTALRSPPMHRRHALKANLLTFVERHRGQVPLLYIQRSPARMPGLYLADKLGLSVPFICQLRTTIKSNQSAILKSFAGKNMLHYLVFCLCIHTNRVHSVFYAEILN